MEFNQKGKNINNFISSTLSFKTEKETVEEKKIGANA